ncbi:MAG TPA: TIGR00282 family metallophosphoesterase [Bacillota bacterium]|nr:TIGR00282 family metallophosphoesterase [Bacillota bacterium]
MRVLFIGDIVGGKGRDTVASHLSRLRQEYAVNYVVANAENAAGGNGLTKAVADELFALGIDVLTSGNHIWDKREILDFIDDYPRILRPGNYPPETPGHSVFFTEIGSPPRPFAVVNLSGRAFMPPIDCPFRQLDALLDQLPEETTVLLDFHAEATSEKVAMGYYADGRVAAVLGTHTHVPTADERILPGGTGYITDVGMCGARESVLGVETTAVIRKFTTGMPVRFAVPEAGEGLLCGVLLEIDMENRRCLSIKRIQRIG